MQNLPDTVMVQSPHTPATKPAVPCSGRPDQLAFSAPVLFHPFRLLSGQPAITFSLPIHSTAAGSTRDAVEPAGAPSNTLVGQTLVRWLLVARWDGQVARVLLGSGQGCKHKD